MPNVWVWFALGLSAVLFGVIISNCMHMYNRGDSILPCLSALLVNNSLVMNEFIKNIHKHTSYSSSIFNIEGKMSHFGPTSGDY